MYEKLYLLEFILILKLYINSTVCKFILYNLMIDYL